MTADVYLCIGKPRDTVVREASAFGCFTYDDAVLE